jgi:hypothetical protein
MNDHSNGYHLAKRGRLIDRHDPRLTDDRPERGRFARSVRKAVSQVRVDGAAGPAGLLSQSSGMADRLDSKGEHGLAN